MGSSPAHLYQLAMPVLLPPGLLGHVLDLIIQPSYHHARPYASQVDQQLLVMAMLDAQSYHHAIAPSKQQDQPMDVVIIHVMICRHARVHQLAAHLVETPECLDAIL